ncbi:MAG: hypothetical protein IKP88_21195 [Lachnospiraceae bacterium]|nr:hypothetical protein [Lachnospiraceae bacterium]
MPWWIYLEFFVLYVGFLGVLTPRLFFKKDAYYLAHIVGELIAFIVFFINMPVSLVIAFLSMFLPTIIIEHFKDNTGHNSYKSSGYGTSKKKDYQKLYPEVFNAVGSSVSKIDTEFGFVRFRMNTVSMFHNEKESLVCTLNKPLSS